jgi:DNA primase
LLPELARQAQLGTDDLAALWGGAAAGAPTTAAHPPGLSRPPARAAVRRGGRRAPAASADLALRLLLRHSDWWERLGAEDQQLLHDLEGSHGQAVAWLERQLTDQGPQTWAALDEALSVEEELQVEARRWVNGGLDEETPDFTELGKVLNALWIARLGDEASSLVLLAGEDAQARQRLQALRQRIAALKTQAATTPSRAG